MAKSKPVQKPVATVKVTVRLPRELWAKVVGSAVRQGITAGSLVADAVESMLYEEEKENAG